MKRLPTLLRWSVIIPIALVVIALVAGLCALLVGCAGDAHTSTTAARTTVTSVERRTSIKVRTPEDAPLIDPAPPERTIIRIYIVEPTHAPAPAADRPGDPVEPAGEPGTAEPR